MRPVSDRFLAAIPYSHNMVARARLCTPGQEGTNPGPLAADGEPLYPLAIEDGDVFFDPAAQIRSTTQITVLADWPASKFDMLNPYGRADLFLERGIVFGDGAREWVSQGYFRLDNVKQRNAPSGPIRIDGSDRMAAIIDARLTTPRQYAASSTLRDVIEDLVLEIYPSATITLSGFDPDVAIGSDQICEQDRYGFLNDIAKAQGCTMYFDYDGTFVMKPVSSYESTERPVWTVQHGEQGVLIELARELTRRSVFNAIVATGEQLTEAEPVQGIAYDLDPNSVTMWGGLFGQVPGFYNSSFLRTVEQAEAAARAMLARRIGLPYTVDFNIVPNPALEPLDLVGISYSDQSGPERHVIDTLTIPLVARRSMTGTTRIRPRGVLE
jgi:hypothetical protein